MKIEFFISYKSQCMATQAHTVSTAQTMVPAVTSTADEKSKLNDLLAVHMRERRKAMAIERNRSYNTGRKHHYRKRYTRKRESTERRGANGDQLIPRFSVQGNLKHNHPVGGKVTRVYEFDFNVQNTASTADSAFINFALEQDDGIASLTAYAGRPVPTVGATLLAFQRFPEEMAAFGATFKWLHVDGMEMDIIPMAKQQNSNINGADMTVDNDYGVIYFGVHDGDESIYDVSTGVAQIGFQEIQMLAHDSIEPLAERSKMIAGRPMVPIQVIPYVNGPDPTMDIQIKYVRMPPIQTYYYWEGAQQMNYGFGGVWWYWYHPNLNANAQKYAFKARLRLQLSWNTVQDRAIFSMADKQERKWFEDLNKSLANKPTPIQIPGEPVKYYPSDPIHFDDKKKQYTHDEEEEFKRLVDKAIANDDLSQLKIAEDYIEVQKKKLQPVAPVVKQGLPGSRPSTPNTRR